MYNIFKTTKSFHHPYELLIGEKLSNFIKHPISTGIYENKICDFGKLISILLIIWIFIRILLKKKFKISLINNIIFMSVLIGSLILNINAFIYFIPIFIYELLI